MWRVSPLHCTLRRGQRLGPFPKVGAEPHSRSSSKPRGPPACSAPGTCHPHPLSPRLSARLGLLLGRARPLAPTPVGGARPLTGWTLAWLLPELGPPRLCPRMPCCSSSHTRVGSAGSAPPARPHPAVSTELRLPTPELQHPTRWPQPLLLQCCPSLPPWALVSARPAALGVPLAPEPRTHRSSRALPSVSPPAGGCGRNAHRLHSPSPSSRPAG